MNLWRTLYHLARADFLERVRRYSFLITLGLTIYLGYVSVPPNHGTYITMEIAGHRPVYDSAYIGAIEAMESVLFLSLAGFYVVRNALERDLQTRVGQILAATPLARVNYTVGKALSNFAVLAAMVVVVAVAAGAMQLIRHEDTTLHIGALLAPFAFMLLPAMAVVAGTAILFESISWLRGGLGNVIYFFLWIFAVSLPNLGDNAFTHPRLSDPLGFSFAVPSLQADCEAAFAGCASARNSFALGFNFKENGQFWDLATYHWSGIHWTPEILLSRVVWFLLGLGLAALAAIFFHRFDPAREKRKSARSRKTKSGEPEQGPWEQFKPVRPIAAKLSPLACSSIPALVRIAPIAKAELRLMLKGRSRWWFIVAGGLGIASFALPVPEARQVMAGFAWLWPVLIWSQIGAREARSGTESLIFSCNRSLYFQLFAVWLAAVIVTMTTGLGYVLRLLISGDLHAALAWLAAALLIPSLAVALGVWSGSSKLFEVIYTLWWYTGPMSHVPGLDFLSSSHSFRTPAIYLCSAFVLLIAAYLGRRRKVGYA